MNTSILTLTHPGMLDFLQRTRAKLSPESQAKVDEHVTRASNVLGTVFGEMPAWRLHDRDGLWFAAADFAKALGVGGDSVRDMADNAIEREEIASADVALGVTQKDVSTSIESNPHNSVTTSPRGITMLSFKAVRRLALLCRGDRGVRFRTKMEEAIDYADMTERSLVAMVLAESERPQSRQDTDRPTEAQTIAAMALLGKLVDAGRRLPRDLQDMACGRIPRQRMVPVRQMASNAPMLTGPVVEPYEPDFGPDFQTSMSSWAAAHDMTFDKAKKLFEEAGMWTNPEWLQHGTAKVKVGPNRLREEPRHKVRRGAFEELMARLGSGPLFAATKKKVR